MESFTSKCLHAGAFWIVADALVFMSYDKFKRKQRQAPH